VGVAIVSTISVGIFHVGITLWVTIVGTIVVGVTSVSATAGASPLWVRISLCKQRAPGNLLLGTVRLPLDIPWEQSATGNLLPETVAL
jgi:hypothetical protein